MNSEQCLIPQIMSTWLVEAYDEERATAMEDIPNIHSNVQERLGLNKQSEYFNVGAHFVYRPLCVVLFTI